MLKFFSLKSDIFFCLVVINTLVTLFPMSSCEDVFINVIKNKCVFIIKICVGQYIFKISSILSMFQAKLSSLKSNYIGFGLSGQSNHDHQMSIPLTMLHHFNVFFFCRSASFLALKCSYTW